MEQLKIISNLSTLLLIIFYLIFRKRNKNKKFRVIFLYAVLSWIFDTLPHIPHIANIFKTNRFYSFSSFTLIEYTIFSYFFYLSYKQKKLKWFTVFCFFLFIIAFVYSIIYNRNIQFDYLPSSIAGTMVIIFSILFFYEQLQHPEINFVYASKTFWIVIGCLIYMSATLFLFISIGVLTIKQEQKTTLWIFNIVSNIITNILFGIAFYKPLTMSIDSSTHEIEEKFT